MWAPRPPGHRHQSCSRPACGQDQALRDTTAGITVLPRMHGRAPWTNPPAGRRATVGREAWGGSAAWTDSLQHGYSNSSASQRLLGLKPPPAPPGEEQDGDGALKVTEKRHNWIFLKVSQHPAVIDETVPGVTGRYRVKQPTHWGSINPLHLWLPC